MMRLIRWILPIMGLLLLAGPLFAQPASPVYLVVSGELWQWTPDANALEPVAACALPPGESYLGPPVISPDDRLLALRIEPALVSDARARVGGWAGGGNPADIAVCDPQAGFLARLRQPDDAALMDPTGKSDHFYMRSAPVWSPDGTRIAWTQGPAQGDPMTVQVLTLADGSVQTLAELPPLYGVPISLPLEWTPGPLIAVVTSTYDFDLQSEFTRVLGFDPATGEQAFVSTLPEADSPYPVTHFWINQAGDARVVVLLASGAWLTINPATGEQALLEGAPELVSAAAPDGVAVVADARALQVSHLRWLARDRDVMTVLGDDVRGFVSPSPAPDGSAVFFYDNLTPAIWRSGTVEMLPLPVLSPNEAVYGVWGYGEWRSFAGAVAPAETGFVCFGAPTPRLSIGGQAAVAEAFGDNNLRAEPSPEGSLLGVIPAGSAVEVLDGPVCAGGYAWWQVAFDGQTGWTAEGEGLDYWLEPAS